MGDLIVADCERINEYHKKNMIHHEDHEEIHIVNQCDRSSCSLCFSWLFLLYRILSQSRTLPGVHSLYSLPDEMRN